MNYYVRAIAKRGPVAGVVVAVGGNMSSCLADAERHGYGQLDCRFEGRHASKVVDDCADDPDLSRRIRESDRRRYGWSYELPTLPAMITGSSYEAREHSRRIGPAN